MITNKFLLLSYIQYLNTKSATSVKIDIFDKMYTTATWTCMCIRKGPTLSILESEIIQPLFEKIVKISNFWVFIDFDSKKAELLYGIYSIRQYILFLHKSARFKDKHLSKYTISYKKINKSLKCHFLKNNIFQIPFSKSYNSVSF